MKCLLKAKAGLGIDLVDLPIPKISSVDVLIKIKKTSICGTDVHIYEWDRWAQKIIKPPVVIGHEYVGEIVEIGSEVKTLKVGDLVSGEGHIPCGFCKSCKNGQGHLCSKNVSVGVTRNGGFAEYLALPAKNAYIIPDGIVENQAAILDPLGNATHIALSHDVKNKDVLITGAGSIGIMVGIISLFCGAKNVVITDINNSRLELAKKLGITNSIDRACITSTIQKLGIKEGFDIGYELSGNAIALDDILTNIAKGGKISLLGFFQENIPVDLDKIIMDGLELKGIYGKKIFDTWDEMIAMLLSGLDISRIITHEFYVDDYKEAFKVMQSKKSGKVILNWEQ